MKEHSLFLLAAFPSFETQFRREADWYREQFEQALAMTVRLANGNVRKEILESGEVVTEHTQMAERQTKNLSGIPIRVWITQAERRLRPGMQEPCSPRLVQQVRQLNRRILRLLDGLIALKERILQEVLSCKLYTANYPLLIEHILREAGLYRQMVQDVEQGCAIRMDDRETEQFWNQIMMEHAEFIRGLLDPTECELIQTADGFAQEYCRLLQEVREADCRMEAELTRQTQVLTEKYRGFKDAGTQGILDCEIRSVILPLLADHVLREANHYLRLLEDKTDRQ